MAVTTLNYHETPPEQFRGGVVTIGNFDGVHAGHQALIRAAHVMAGGNFPVIPVAYGAVNRQRVIGSI